MSKGKNTSKEYFSSRNGREEGPFSFDELVEQLVSRKLELMDQVRIGRGGEWGLFAENLEFVKAVKAQGRVAADSSPKPAATEHDITEWFVLKGEQRFGPFNYPQMIRMLQEKVSFPFDYAWHSGLSGWKRINDIAEFQPAAIRAFVERPSDVDAIIQRKHPRFEHQGRVIVHDQKDWWNAQALELSAGGVGVVIENALLIPGQTVHLHFKKHNEYPAFNAVGEIAAKKFVENLQDKSQPLQYGVRFTAISGNDKDRLLEMLKEKAA